MLLQLQVLSFINISSSGGGGGSGGQEHARSTILVWLACLLPRLLATLNTRVY
jgi:hypothetical protein